MIQPSKLATDAGDATRRGGTDDVPALAGSAPFTAADLGFMTAPGGGWQKVVGGRETIFRPLRRLRDLLPVEALQREIFGVTDRDLAAASLLVVVPETGGEVIGAYQDDEVVGFVVGWGGYVEGRPRLLSDMLGVRTERRGGGLGAELKKVQAAIAVGRGFGEVIWTVDPLRAANARLNIEKLGAHADRYEIDRYGAEYGAGLYGGLPTDRLHMVWPLYSERVRERLLGRRPPITAADVVGLAPFDPDHPAGRALVALPADVDRLLATDPGRVAGWRLSLRETLGAAFGRGYAITGFVGAEPGSDQAHYLIER